MASAVGGSASPLRHEARTSSPGASAAAPLAAPAGAVTRVRGPIRSVTSRPRPGWTAIRPPSARTIVPTTSWAVPERLAAARA